MILRVGVVKTIKYDRELGGEKDIILLDDEIDDDQQGEKLERKIVKQYY